ncbi:MAG: hypothetical protein COB07_04785 [Sulfurovum sp.]|nr:MAG: hypothetical protein COB07_04785 [Sulfurovum sp.]
MSNTRQIDISLKNLILDDDREFVAMLSGEWGIGKTYFWKKLFTKEELKKSKKSITYLSLFGYSSIQSIKNDIVLKLSKEETTKAIFADAFRHFRTTSGTKEGDESSGLSLSGSIISSALSIIPEKSLKGSIICFDDFERLSDKVSFKDVMGLIAQFKEQKECKVVIILNEGELSDENQKIFSRNKEKIVDYNFHYQPSQKELFVAIKEDIEKITWCEYQTIYNFFEKIYLKNIRIMKQALYLLEKFSFIKSESYDKKVIDEFVKIALNIFVFRITSNFSYQELQDFKEYKTKILSETLFSDNKKIVRVPNFDKYLNSYEGIPYYITNDNIEKILYNFIETYYIHYGLSSIK